MFKKSNVVMLPTNEKAIIGDLALSHNNVLNFAKNEDWLVIYNPIKQHLYITSDEEIKSRDWMYSKMDGYPTQWDGDLSATKNPKEYGYNKIIASTDISLEIEHPYSNDTGDMNFPLPKPSQQFIEKYIEEYNKSNVITNVLVEYFDNGEEGWNGSNEDGEPIWNEKIELKVNPKDNTITIKKVKDSWNREEHIQDIKRIILLEREYQDLTHHFIDTIDLDKFITDNL